MSRRSSRRVLVGVTLGLALAVADARAQGWLVGAAKVDITPPAFEATTDAAFFSSVDPIVDATCPRTTFDGPRLWLYEEPYQDLDGSGDFSYPLGSPPDVGLPVPEPFCDYNHNGRWDGFYSSGGSEQHVLRIHDPIDVRAVAFSDGSNTAVLASVVAQGIHENYTHEMRDRARQLTGNAQLETFVSANHNESSPDTVGIYGGPAEAGVTGLNSGIDEYYMDFVVEQVARAAQQATDDLRPASLWVREFQLPAGLDVRLSNNFPTTADGGLPAAVDLKVRVLQARDAANDPIVTVMNLAAHNQEIGHDGPVPGDVSSDWPGYFHARLESNLGRGMAMFLVGDNGSEEDPQTVPEVSGDQYAKAEAVGEALADAVASRIGDAETVQAQVGQLVAERTELFVPIENNLFKAAAAARLFGERQAYTGGVPTPDGTDVRTEVGILELGPDIQMIANPGEAFPALMLGSPWGIEDAGCDQRPNPPVPTWHARAAHRLQLGLTNDLIGYEIPAWAFSAIPGAFTNEPPNADGCVNDQDDHDPKGHQHKLETEGVGPSASNIVAQSLTTLLDQRPDAIAQIRLGRFVMPDGSLSRRAEGAVAILMTTGTCPALTPEATTLVALPSITDINGRVPDLVGGFMDYDGVAQPAPDILTRGMWAGDTPGAPVARYYVDVYPALAETGICPTATPTPWATPTATPSEVPPTLTPAPTVTPGVVTCGSVPSVACRPPAVAGQARLQLRNISPDTKDRLQWKWLKGTATAKGDFGDPTTTTGYTLCVYDGNASLIASAAMPANGSCNAASPRPCWRENVRGFRYLDKDLTPSGIQQLVLKSGPDGKAQIGVKGRGRLLADPMLPIVHLPVTVQLVSSAGQCWTASYHSSFRNDMEEFKAKAD